MKRLLVILFLLFCTNAVAGDLPDTDAGTIKAAGIPIYKSSVFAYGNKDVGFRFASGDSPDKIRQWYREQLSGWSVFDQYGSWIIYDGNAGVGMGEIMSANQVAVQQNNKLPEWHSLEKDMTTEIVIMVVK